MAKALGIIGNIKGKVGNVVGYNLTDSNNKQTQGLRVYQPNVKNPKTAAQAEQRAKLAPINATYRALKMIIDRGNEGLPYGNKSRLAWLKKAFMAEGMPWIEKGGSVNYPVICLLTKGSLNGLQFSVDGETVIVSAPGVTGSTSLTTVGGLSTALLASNPQLKAGDQITIVIMEHGTNALKEDIYSFVIDTTSTEAFTKAEAAEDTISFKSSLSAEMGAVIVSREGDNGEHLRSTSFMAVTSDLLTAAPYNATSKTAAIESYMASGSANTDWAEESIQ